MAGCAYDCRHPLWGGHGVCIETDDAAEICECDDGFATRDALGNPSCVRKAALMASYVLVAFVAVCSTLFFVYTSGCGAVFCIAASLGGNVPLWGNGLCEVFLVMIQPFRAMAIMMVAALWVNSLPSQVLPATSFAIRLKEFTEAKHVFGVLGLASMGILLSIGVYSFFNPPKAMRLADLLSAFGEALVGFCIIFVAAQTLRVIERSQEQASNATRVFYGRAKKMLVTQMLVICSAITLFLVATWMIHLTTVGAYTAVIPLVVRFVDGMLGLCAVVHFTRPERPNNPKATTGREIPSKASSFASRAWQKSVQILQRPVSLVGVSSSRKKRVAAGSTTGSSTLSPRGSRGGSIAGNVVIPTAAVASP